MRHFIESFPDDQAVQQTSRTLQCPPIRESRVSRFKWCVAYGDTMLLHHKYDAAPLRNDTIFAQCAVRHTSFAKGKHHQKSLFCQVTKEALSWLGWMESNHHGVSQSHVSYR